MCHYTQEDNNMRNQPTTAETLAKVIEVVSLAEIDEDDRDEMLTVLNRAIEGEYSTDRNDEDDEPQPTGRTFDESDIETRFE